MALVSFCCAKNTIEGYMNKCKLLFLCRLLQANCCIVYKKVFLFLLTRSNNGIDIGNCISKDLFDILQLYELGHVLRQHLDGETHYAYIWKRVVRESISRAEEQSWSLTISQTTGMHLFSYIHPELKPHSLWYLCYVHPHYQSELGFLVQLGSCGQRQS
jgi:hypothetical protein